MHSMYVKLHFTVVMQITKFDAYSLLLLETYFYSKEHA